MDGPSPFGTRIASSGLVTGAAAADCPAIIPAAAIKQPLPGYPGGGATGVYGLAMTCRGEIA